MICMSQQYHQLTFTFSFLFLEIAKEREVEGDLLLGDIGDGIPFKPGTFDGAYSVSTLQWLCNADKSSHKPVKRLYSLFSTLLACLVTITLILVTNKLLRITCNV